MNKKDIALTVGGVVATLAFSYWIYTKQASDATPATDDSLDVAAGYPYQASPSISLPALTTGVDSSGSSGYHPSDSSDLVNQILGQILNGGSSSSVGSNPPAQTIGLFNGTYHRPAQAVVQTQGGIGAIVTPENPQSLNNITPTTSGSNGPQQGGSIN